MFLLPRKKIIFINAIIFFLVLAIILFFVKFNFNIHKQKQGSIVRTKKIERLFSKIRKEEEAHKNKRKKVARNVILPKYYQLTEKDCAKIIDEELKKECYSYFKYKNIVEEGEVKNCVKLDEEWYDICIYDILEEKSNDWQKCLLIKNIVRRDICLEHKAIDLKDNQICQNMEEGKEECVDRAIAINHNFGDDIKECGKIGTPEYFERCVVKSFYQPCSRLGDKKFIDKCESFKYFAMIINNGDEKDCSIMPLPSFRNVCSNYFKNNKNFIDSDGDGVLDHNELMIGTNPFDKNDGLEAKERNAEEERMNVLKDNIKFKVINKLRDLTVDTDADGLRDYEENNIYHTDFQNQDTDGDGYKDGEEIKAGFNPTGDGKL